MDYAQTVAYLFSQLPMFQRIGAAAYKADLSNTIAFCELMDNPQDKFKSIHIAGTNGKGSISSALASIFATCGYKTGLFTSPHLKDYRERIRINGAKISEEFVIDFVEKYKTEAAALEPSFFEYTCAMAFAYFAEAEVDIAILEVGMGGRLDSTNVVTPEIAVITSIGLDHQQYLGTTLEEIAAEKGGIIKPNVPVVIGNNEAGIETILANLAIRKEAPFVFARDTRRVYATDLKGAYQTENMRTVATVVSVARDLGFELKEACAEEGAMHVAENTGLRGRWETLSIQPRIIVDVGHNASGVARVVEALRRESFVRLHMVWGMVSDKDASAILKLLPTSATYYWCKPDVPRGKNAQELGTEAMKFSLEGRDYPSVTDALAAAKREAGLSDLIFVGGSVFVVAEIL